VLKFRGTGNKLNISTSVEAMSQG